MNEQQAREAFSEAVRAPTVAQLIEHLRDWPDETLVYVLDKEGVADRVLEPFAVMKYPDGNPHRCVIAAYSYDAEEDGYSYGDEDEDD